MQPCAHTYTRPCQREPSHASACISLPSPVPGHTAVVASATQSPRPRCHPGVPSLPSLSLAFYHHGHISQTNLPTSPPPAAQHKGLSGFLSSGLLSFLRSPSTHWPSEQPRPVTDLTASLLCGKRFQEAWPSKT